MKLLSLENQAQITYRVSLWYLMLMTFLNNLPHQKLLEIALNSKLNINAHADKKIEKRNRIIGLIRRLLISLLRNALFTLYKSSLRPHLLALAIFYMINQTMKIFRTN